MLNVILASHSFKCNSVANARTLLVVNSLSLRDEETVTCRLQ